jgi:hypothetical protein
MFIPTVLTQTAGIGAVNWILLAGTGGMGERQAAGPTRKKAVAWSAVSAGCLIGDCETRKRRAMIASTEPGV